MATNPRAVGEITQAIASEVRAQRAARRLTQEQLSAATGIPGNTLSKIERGQMAIDAEQIKKIATAFGMLPGHFMDTAERNAALRDGDEVVYRADGTLNPENTRGFTPTDDDLTELFSEDEGTAG